MNNTSSAIVLVHYHPTPEDLTHSQRLLEKYNGIVVDNSQENRGIAEAQNLGISRVLQLWPETKYIVFLDQDSRVDDDYPQQIAAIYRQLEQLVNIGMLGPTVRERESGEEYRPMFDHPHPHQSFIARREIISSGSCVAVRVLRDVGLNDSALFIDYVDFEWCWRARAKGYQSGITTALCIVHQVGHRQLRLGRYRVIVSAPFRYYYSYRNYLWLTRRSYVPLRWKLTNGVKRLARFCYLPFLIDDGLKTWKYMCRGIADGLRKPKDNKPPKL